MFDRNAYFNAVRGPLFGGALEQVHVDGQNVILAVWEFQAGGTPMTDIRWLAYMLATVYVETGKMWPRREIGKGQGYSYGQPDSETGEVYYGRGLVQLTHKSNYDKASAALSLIDERDLVWHPDVALDCLIATRIMFRGMSEGWFTGAKLGQFFNETKDDPVNARTIINGHDRDTEIAGYHHTFLEALKVASIDSVAA